MLLDVGNKVSASHPKNIGNTALVRLGLFGFAAACAMIAPSGRDHFSLLSIARAQHSPTVGSSASNQTPAAQSAPAATLGAQSPASQTPATQTPAAGTPGGQTAQRQAPSIVVLDPAHGGTDLGARGTAGIRESEVVLQFAAQVRTALESQGFQVMQTRQGNENPSFDDRSAIANSQRGAVFVSLHIGSTGLPGTVRVYVMSDLPTSNDANGLIPWDRAQAPFVPLSRRWGDMVQGFLLQRFKGSPSTARTGAVRQLRTTAAPAIAVEVSSVSMEDRNALDRMAPGVADAIARGASAFRPLYVVAAVNPGDRP
jgi:N-acetylmuramoyl-L-alanine amidase